MELTSKWIFLIIICIIFIYSYNTANTDIVKDPISRQYEYIQHYLLKDSSLAQSKKPIMWIHIDYEQNSRNWLDFNSRNTFNLNQPYIYLTLKSIIDKCGESFNICIIDDSTFKKIIPGWLIDFKSISKPIKPHIRQLALCKVLYLYGGINIPPTTICTNDLASLYKKDMFVGEFPQNNTLSPSPKIIGCPKNCPKMKEFIEYLEIINSNDFTSAFDFIEKDRVWIINKVKENYILCIDGFTIGTKDKNNSIVTIDSLISEKTPDLSDNALCVVVDENELLKRTKYNWFCRLSPEQVLNSNTSIGTLLLNFQ
tara:strand:- start:400 stop:1335 length:936 start_codon:yes stop_codon:yes gene_type:complete